MLLPVVLGAMCPTPMLHTTHATHQPVTRFDRLMPLPRGTATAPNDSSELVADHDMWGWQASITKIIQRSQKWPGIHVTQCDVHRFVVRHGTQEHSCTLAQPFM